MEKLTKYRQLIEQILLEHGKHKSAYGDIEVQTITERNFQFYQEHQ
ncbi:MAG: element excision factor XisI family protein [Rivularia sp. (in: cyanobacteria)]